MGIKSTPDRYGAVAITIHCVTALAILTLIVLGLSAERATDDALRRTLLSAHIALGLFVLLLTVLRIVWFVFADRRPPPLATTPKLQARIAALVHGLLYGLIIALAASGIATNILSGLLDALSTGAPLPDLSLVPPRAAHGLFAWMLMGLLAVHIGAALYHHWIRRDPTLARMGIGRLPR